MGGESRADARGEVNSIADNYEDVILSQSKPTDDFTPDWAPGRPQRWESKKTQWCQEFGGIQV